MLAKRVIGNDEHELVLHDEIAELGDAGGSLNAVDAELLELAGSFRHVAVELDEIEHFLDVGASRLDFRYENGNEFVHSTTSQSSARIAF